MVIYTGRGWVGFLFVVGCLIGGNELADRLLGEGYFEAHIWPKLAALLTCSILCWIAGRRWNRDLPRRVFELPRRGTNPVTGAFRPKGTRSHTLAFVRLEYARLVAFPLYLFVALEEAGLV